MEYSYLGDIVLLNGGSIIRNEYVSGICGILEVYMTEDDYKFIEEKIKPQKLRKVTKHIKKIGITASFAVLFGVIAAGAFCLTHNILSSGDDVEPQPSVSLPENTLIPTATSVVTAAPITTKKPIQTEKPDKNTTHIDNMPDLNDFSKMYRVLSDYCETYNKSIVTVSKIHAATDYFDTIIEAHDSFSGLILQINNNTMYVLTQYDCVDNASSYQIFFQNKVSVNAKILGTDKSTGLAVMSADISEMSNTEKSMLMTAELGSSDSVKTGDMIVAIGNPMGSMYSIDYGIVNQEPLTKYMYDRHVILFGTSIFYSGNGAGVIMNTSGKVVGIISHRFDEYEPQNTLFIGINELKDLIEQLMNNEARPRIGIIVNDTDSSYLKEYGLENGVYVSDVASGSPAMDAAISIGDVIVSIDNERIDNVSEYTKVLASYEVDSEVSISVYRTYAKKNENRTVTVRLGSADPVASY